MKNKDCYHGNQVTAVLMSRNNNTEDSETILANDPLH